MACWYRLSISLQCTAIFSRRQHDLLWNHYFSKNKNVYTKVITLKLNLQTATEKLCLKSYRSVFRYVKNKYVSLPGEEKRMTFTRQQRDCTFQKVSHVCVNLKAPWWPTPTSNVSFCIRPSTATVLYFTIYDMNRIIFYSFVCVTNYDCDH